MKTGGTWIGHQEKLSKSKLSSRFSESGIWNEKPLDDSCNIGCSIWTGYALHTLIILKQEPYPTVGPHLLGAFGWLWIYDGCLLDLQWVYHGFIVLL